MIEAWIFRHPVSAATHLLFALWALYATAVLVRMAVAERRGVIAVFGLSLVALYAASGAYHACPADWPRWVDALRRLDLALIHVLIAGTCTPVFALLSGWWRRGLLAGTWLLAIAGAVSKCVLPLPPHLVTIVLYAATAALGLGAIAGVHRVVGRSGTRWLLGGAMVYATGAMCEALVWPTLLPGIVGPHEVLHLCDMGGSVMHVVFVARYASRNTP